MQSSSARQTRIHYEDIPYRSDSATLFRALRQWPEAAWLDSCPQAPRGGRYDILVAAPSSQGPAALPAGASAQACLSYFDDLAVFCRDYYRDIGGLDADLPFCGGLLGYIGYEGGYALNRVVPARAATVTSPALARLRAYDWCVIQDHLLRRSVLVCLPQVGLEQRRELLAALASADHRPAPDDFELASPFRSNLDRAAYGDAFNRIQHYIRAGDCYQVNLAQRFSAGFSGDPFNAYTRLRTIAGAPFSGYMEWDEGALLCLSPERFLALQGRHVETKPIKGTRPRCPGDTSRDAELARALLESEKDRAENLMIVDLLRNDLGRSCLPGSIHVEKLFDVESYPTVHHLVSTISGELKLDRGAIELLRDSFPGGSITGAPKRRAMEIIAELEPHRREAYCGSLLYISADGRMDSNIAIRSLLAGSGEIACWAGGGIVADSQCEQEYQETFDKVGGFLTALEADLTAGAQGD